MNGRAPEFTLSNVQKSYGDLRVLDGVTLEAERDRILAVLGPSACGKTTLLSLIAGLIAPDRGEIEGLAGKAVSYAFQEPRLLDWLTVEDNIAFVLEDLMPRAAARAASRRYLERMGLADCRCSYPRRLSGGQRQRLAMARALAYPSRILLMDEPFRSLDLGLKIELIAVFLREWREAPRTVVCVTHDVYEALLLADEIAVLTPKPTTVRSRRRIETPRESRRLDDPALIRLESEIVADLLGDFQEEIRAR